MAETQYLGANRMMRRMISVVARYAALIVVALGLQPAYAAEVVVTDARVGHHADKTRFVLDMSRGVDIRFFMLDNPYRVVLDLPEVGWRLPAQPLPGPTGVFRTMRYGLYQPGQSRIVVETSGPVSVKTAFFLKPMADGGSRFVLDLVPVEASVFAGAMSRSATVQPGTPGYANPQQSWVSTTNSAAQSPTTTTQPQPQPIAQAPVQVSALEARFQPAPRKPVYQPHVKRVVVIDAGHGGADPGTIGTSGVYEKNITVAAARAMKAHLEASGRYKVVLTRERDVFIRLRERVAKARKAGAELFISVHADSIKDRSVRGASIYTLSETASDKEAAALAEKENKADLIGTMDLNVQEPDIANILIDLAQRESMNESARFANILVKELKRSTKILRKPHRFAGFAVLKAPDVPSVLVEMGFLSNKSDEKNLQSKAFRKKLAQVMLQAVDRYFTQVQQANSN